MTLAPELDRHCERAGMSQEEPLRMAFSALGKGVDSLDGKITRLGEVASVKAAEGAVSVVRAELRRLLLGANALRVAIYVAAPLAALMVGFWAGSRQAVPTNIGPLNPDTVRLFQSNDMEAAAKACVAQPPLGGQEWCKMNLWRPRGAPPA